MFIGPRVARHSVGNRYHRPRLAGGALVIDNFNAPDGTFIQDHQPMLGGLWRLRTPGVGPPVADQIVIQSNALTFLAGGQGCVQDVLVSDCAVRVMYTPGAASRDGIFMRAPSDGNGISFRLRVPEDTIDLVVWTGGTISATLDTAAMNLFGGRRYVLEMVTRGQDIECYMDNTLVLQGTTAAHETATDHGLTSYGTDYNESFDSFLITDRKS